MITQLKENILLIYETLQEKLVPENIREGVTIFNVEGTFSVINSEEYVALSNEIIKLENISQDILSGEVIIDESGE